MRDSTKKLQPVGNESILSESAMKSSMSTEGPSSDLISQINYLGLLLRNLPERLPCNPAGSKYQFGFDMDDLKAEGVHFAFNRNLEVCFETFKLRNGENIVIKEQGPQFDHLIAMFKRVVKEVPEERDFIKEHWLERLVTAAKESGAKIPKR